MSRTLLAATAVALGLLATAGCSSDVTDAATVNGVGISRRGFESELHAFVDNQAYQAYLAQASGPTVVGPGGDTVTMSFTDSQLRLEILYELVRQEVVQRGLQITPEIRRQADEAAKANTLNFVPEANRDAVWAQFPDSFRRDAADDTAQLLALQDAAGGSALDDASLQKLYDQNPARFGLMCARHLLVTTEAEAKALKAQLDSGADFGTLASANSTDTGSASQAGRLYTEGEACPSTGTYDYAFVDGAFSVPVGQVTGPIQTQFGWHLIVVDQSKVVPFADAKPTVSQYVSQRSSAELNDVLRDAAKGDISVAPKYGTWDPATANIVPPGGSTTTTTTG